MALARGLLDTLESLLIEERERIRKELDTTNRFGLGDSMRDSIGELSLADNHPADIGDELFERGKDLSLRELKSIRLHKIENALDRMNKGTYGLCEECGCQISYARLEAEPAANLCISCQNKRDMSENFPPNRPIEEEFLQPGFGRTDLDQATEISANGFDGEDSWQDVARYGTSGTLSDGFSMAGLDEHEFFIESQEPIGYVEDVEGFLTADIYGNPTGFARNEAYYRNVKEQDGS